MKPRNPAFLLAGGLVLALTAVLAVLFCREDSRRVQTKPLPAPAPHAIHEKLADCFFVNQIGFAPGERKECLMLVDDPPVEAFFVLRDEHGAEVFRAPLTEAGAMWGKRAYVGDFSGFNRTGAFRASCGKFKTPPFAVDRNVWAKRVPAGRILDSFFRKQRCVEESYGYPKDMDGTHKDLDLKLPVYELKPVAGGWREEPTGRTYPNALGGWHDATSTDKETVKIAYTAQTMMLAAELAPGYFSAQDRRKLEEEIRWGVEFLFKMQDEDGGVFLAVKPHDWWEEGSLPRRLLANKETGVTAKTASCWATAAVHFAESDPELSARCLDHALKAFAWVEKNPGVFFPKKMYPDYWTGKTSALLWAECELYRAVKRRDPARAAELFRRACERLRSGRMENGIWLPAAGVHDDNAMGAAINEPTVFAMCRMLPELEPPLRDKVQSDLRAWAAYWSEQSRNPCHFPQPALTPLFGVNGWMIQVAANLLVAGTTLKDSGMTELGKDYLRWVFGANPFATSFVVGFGEKDVKNPFKRPYHASVGGVVPGILDVDEDGDPEMRGREEWQTQECTLDYSAALLFDLSLVDAEGEIR